MEVFVNDGLYCLAEDGRGDGEAKSTGECQRETVFQLFSKGLEGLCWQLVVACLYYQLKGKSAEAWRVFGWRKCNRLVEVKR